MRTIRICVWQVPGVFGDLPPCCPSSLSYACRAAPLPLCLHASLDISSLRLICFIINVITLRQFIVISLITCGLRQIKHKQHTVDPVCTPKTHTHTHTYMICRCVPRTKRFIQILASSKQWHEHKQLLMELAHTHTPFAPRKD